MKTNVKKAKMPKEINNSDDMLSNTFNSIACKDPISDEGLNDFIRICSEIT